MQLLIAHGQHASQQALRRVVADLPDAELDIVECDDSEATIDLLLASEAPNVVLVDWDLPGCDGPELCRLVRAYYQVGRPYIILLASRNHRLAEGLEAGADDCVHTPVPSDELQARIRVGLRFAAAAVSQEQVSVTLVAGTWPEDADGDVDGDAGQRESSVNSTRLAALTSNDWDNVAEMRGRKRFELDTLLVSG